MINTVHALQQKSTAYIFAKISLTYKPVLLILPHIKNNVLPILDSQKLKIQFAPHRIWNGLKEKMDG
jgi:hypothetical protein